MKIKFKITDNIKTLNPNRTLIDILRVIVVKKERKKLIESIKYKFISYIKTKFSKIGLLESIDYKNSQLINDYNYAKKIICDDITPSEKLDIESYILIRKFKKQLHKDIKENLPRILSDISKNLNLYRWKVEILFEKDIPDLFIIDLGKSSMSMRKISYESPIHTKIILTSLDDPSIKGELLIDSKSCLSSGIIPVSGIKNGTINLIRKTLDGYLLWTSDLKRESNEFVFLMSSIDGSFNIDSFSSNYKNKEISRVVNNIKNVIKIFDFLKGKPQSFVPVLLISDRIEWKILLSERSSSSLSGSYEYYADNKKYSENINNHEIVKEIVDSLDVFFETNDKSGSLKDFYDYLKEALDANETSNKNLIGINETLKLLEY